MLDELSRRSVGVPKFEKHGWASGCHRKRAACHRASAACHRALAPCHRACVSLIVRTALESPVKTCRSSRVFRCLLQDVTLPT